MARDMTWTYSNISLFSGGVIGIVLAFGYKDLVNTAFDRVLGLLQVTFVPAGYVGPVAYMFVLSALGLIFYFFVFLSQRIDGDLEGDDVYSRVNRFAVVAFFGFGLFSNVYLNYVTDNHSPVDSVGFGEIVFGLILHLVGLVLLIPFVAFNFFLVPVVVALIIAGIICLPRVLMYHLTVHPLGRAVENANRGAPQSAEDVWGGLGTPSRNKTEGLALQHQAEAMLKEMREKKRELEQAKEELGVKILDDAKRFEVEKELSKTLAEIEMLRVQVAEYEKQLKRGRTS